MQQLRADFDFVVDVRTLDDPASKDVRVHPGTHYLIVHGVVSHSMFQQKLHEFKVGMEQCASPCCRVLIHCNAGKHRCIAFALCIQYCLRLTSVSCNLQHLGTWWRNRSCLSGSCELCLESRRMQDFQRALEMWRKI